MAFSPTQSGFYRDRCYMASHSTSYNRPGLSFTYVDRVYDALLEAGVRPLAELSSMPVALASGTQTVSY